MGNTNTETGGNTYTVGTLTTQITPSGTRNVSVLQGVGGTNRVNSVTINERVWRAIGEKVGWIDDE